MRLGILSDAHGNPYGLAACLGALARMGIERIHFLGDAVGYFPDEAEVLELLARAGVLCQRGNHEAMLLGELPYRPELEPLLGIGAARSRLSAEVLEQVRAWPLQREEFVNGRRLLLIHGSPDALLDGYVYADSDHSRFAGLPYDVVLMGHTHRPFVRRLEAGPLLVNVGSCGLPRDHGRLASFAVYDAVADQADIYRLPFDTTALLATIEAGRASEMLCETLERTAAHPSGIILEDGRSHG